MTDHWQPVQIEPVGIPLGNRDLILKQQLIQRQIPLLQVGQIRAHYPVTIPLLQLEGGKTDAKWGDDLAYRIVGAIKKYPAQQHLVIAQAHRLRCQSPVNIVVGNQRIFYDKQGGIGK